MFNQFNIFTTDKDLTGLDDTISAFIKKLNKKLKLIKHQKRKGSKSTSKSSKSVKGDSDASAKKDMVALEVRARR